MTTQYYDPMIYVLDSHVLSVGGQVKLKDMNRTEYTRSFMHVYGVEYDADGTTKYKLRVTGAETNRSYDGKYIKVNADRVDKTRFHAQKDVFLGSPIFAAALRKAGLHPETIVAPEFVVDADFCDGWQGYNTQYHADRYNLRPIWGYIVYRKPDGVGFHQNFVPAFERRSDGIIYVPVEIKALGTVMHDFYMGKHTAFFIKDPELSEHPRVEEYLKAGLPAFFPDLERQIQSTVFVMPFRNMYDHPAAINTTAPEQQAPCTAFWARSQMLYIGDTACVQAVNHQKTYTSLAEHCAVVDRPMALAMCEVSRTAQIVLNRNARVRENTELTFCFQLQPGVRHPGELAAQCYGCNCVCLNWAKYTDPQSGELAPYCSPMCHHMHSTSGGALAAGYSMCNTNAPPPPLPKPSIGVPAAKVAGVSDKPDKVTAAKAALLERERAAMLAEQEARRERSRLEFETIKRRHDEREKLVAAERKLQEVQRRRQIAESRHLAEEKKEKEEVRRIADAAPKQPPPSKKKDKVRSRQGMADEAVAAIHAVHIDPEQKSFRSRDFDRRQEREHLEAEERKAKALVDKEREIVHERECARALHEQASPPAHTLGAFTPTLQQ